MSLPAFGFAAVQPAVSDAPTTHATLRGPANTVELRLVRGVVGQVPDAADTLEAAFNALDATIVARLVPPTPLDGAPAPTAPDLTVRLRHHRVAGDIGLLVLECAPADAPRPPTVTTTETTRKSPDGFWRYTVAIPIPAAT